MTNIQIGDNCELVKTIVAENVTIGNNAHFGYGPSVENETDPHIYNHDLVCIGEKSVIPDGITVGKNEKKITEYIQNQLKEDYMSEQLVLDMTDPFTGSRK